MDRRRGRGTGRRRGRRVMVRRSRRTRGMRRSRRGYSSRRTHTSLLMRRLWGRLLGSEGKRSWGCNAAEGMNEGGGMRHEGRG